MKRKGGCEVKYCRKHTEEGRKKCSMHRRREWVEKNPLKYAYGNLKSSARKRNIEFTLTLEEFTEFCQKTEYISRKGRHREAYTIDRIENDKGYTKDNIQILTYSQNCSKGARSVVFTFENGKVEFRTVTTRKEEVDGPF